MRRLAPAFASAFASASGSESFASASGSASFASVFAASTSAVTAALAFVAVLSMGFAPSAEAAFGSGGANEGGTLILHAATGTVYTVDGVYCGLSGLADCADAEVRVDQAEPVVAHVLASFFPGTEPRMAGVVFGIDYDPNIVVLTFGACGEFELAQNDWPAAGSGTAVTWAETQTDDLVEVYWLAAYTEDGQSGRLELGAHPTQGAFFADDSVPGILDPIAGFGALGFYTNGTVACPASPGACCFEDGSCELLPQGPCETQNGTWLPDVTCDPNPCPQPPYGACCFESGTCQFTLEGTCDSAGGTWLSDTSCDPNPCPQPPIGACCWDDGACVPMTSGGCDQVGGTYQGDGTSCDPNPCPQPLGACCFPSGECQFLTASDCGGAGGHYQGMDTLCDPNPCVATTEGACCLTLGTCELLLEAVCDTQGGTFQGVGALCVPNPCPQPCEPFDRSGRPNTKLPAPSVDPFRTGNRDGQIGPNAGGTLVLHLGPALAYSEGGAGADCDLGAGIDGCEDIVARVDEEIPVLLYAAALFPSTSAPRLLGLTFGIDFPDCVQLLEWEPCGDFEIANDDWPAPGSGTAMTWAAPQTEFAVPVYKFIASGLAAEPGEFALVANPTQGALFADDSVPSFLDPIAGLGSFGFFRDGVVPCPQPQEAIGACCFEDGSCLVRTIPACDAEGGEFFGVNIYCNPNPCPQPMFGACCYENGTCAPLSPEDCTASGGEFQGDETRCYPNPCPQPPTGACCFANGNCSVLTEPVCTQNNGNYQGDDTTCSPNPCPQPTGACCIGETCEILTQAECQSAGGTWLGFNRPCDPNPCLPSVGACCFPGGSCEQLTETECTEQGGFYLDDDRPCDPNPCPTGGEGCGAGFSFEETIALRRQAIEARENSEVPHAAETGPGSGTTTGLGTAGSCGNLFFNADGTYENGYTWQYGGVQAPTYGAFAELYDSVSLRPCSVVLDLTAVGNQIEQTMDLYTWERSFGLPGAILGARIGVTPGAIAFWPSVSRHVFDIESDCSGSGGTFAGYWGNWPNATAGWYVGADLDGFGGCPLTQIAPGLGYPTGWQNVSLVWGPTQAIGIGAEFVDCGGTPVRESSWGKVKALFR
ncbi:MAG: hypothetical protein KDA27_08535 [Candidatus Eisenbacteria bacterium]|uniref:Uncharacterized protein n=1 Tax=Eiseniibacteriota bacterium TaxID=2212470 RepID=A0A956NBN4_UNCEI|nr:hypothetical protein [Candidatus Eisenbacteria bacterium]MCB9466296.1 hypothetical protein [Candidatus Eisenbacteria bacterium]